MQLGRIWTLKQATRIGLPAAFAALLLWPAYAVAQGSVRPAFIGALALTCFCGVSILFITTLDLVTVERARSILPVRIFDLALGAVLTIPAGAALATLI